MLKNLLLYRFGIVNAVLGGLLAFLASKGYVGTAVDSDPTGIILVIFALFVALLGSTFHRVVKTARGLNAIKANKPPMDQPFRKRLTKIKHINDGASWLAYLGLIGTVVGFLIALQGIDLGALSTAQGVQAMVPKLMQGLGVALYTTLSGAFFGIWTEINYRMLHTATECLVEDEKQAWNIS